MTQDNPQDIRANGWSVAVHNDYHLNGKGMTFWLFTRGDYAVRGEGYSDAEALQACRAAIARLQDGQAETTSLVTYDRNIAIESCARIADYYGLGYHVAKEIARKIRDLKLAQPKKLSLSNTLDMFFAGLPETARLSQAHRTRIVQALEQCVLEYTS